MRKDVERRHSQPGERGLQSYAAVLEAEGLLREGSEENPAVKSLTFDTRDVGEKALFFCKGAHFKEEYLKEAEEKGAVGYVAEERHGSRLPCLLVSDVRKAMSVLAPFHYGYPQEELAVVGITGTKGKSTVAYYLKAILDKAYPKECAILSSVDNYDGVIREESHLTTPEALTLFRHLANAADEGIPALVMEVSSQALKYGRVEGLIFDAACFHNIGSDHISPIEHPDFEDYFSSKLKILDACRVACINTDAELAEKVLERAKRNRCRIVRYGKGKGNEVTVSGGEKREGRIFFRVRTPRYEREMSLAMPGLFNVSNAAAAIALAEVLEVPEEAVAEGLREARVKGRMEVFPAEDGRTVAIVDYAHNRMSFEALHRSVREEYPGKKLIFVFGSAGGKAYSRRRDLGDAAGELADFTVITEEDSGEEPFEKIARDLGERIAAKGGKYTVIEDRGEAIRKAIFGGEEDKVVLVLGKGRETRQKRGTEYVPVPSDVDYVKEAIEEYSRRKAHV